MRRWQKGFILKFILLIFVYILPFFAVMVLEKFQIKIHKYLIILVIETVVFLISYFIFELRLKEYYGGFREKLKKISRSYIAENSREEKFNTLDSMTNLEYFLTAEIDKLAKFLEKNSEKIVELERENYTKFQVKEYQLKSVVKELEKLNDRMKRKEVILDSYIEMQEEMLNTVRNYNMFFDEVLFFLEKKLRITDITVVRYDNLKPIIYTKLSNERKISEIELEELRKYGAGLYYKQEINAMLGYEIIFILASKKYFHGYIFINGFSSKYLEYPVFMKIVSNIYMGILNMADNIRDREECGQQVDGLKSKIQKLNGELSKSQEELEVQLNEISNMYEEIVTLYEAGRAIVKIIDIKSIENLILDMLTDIIGVESAYVFYYKKDREQPLLKNFFFKNGVNENFLKDIRYFIKNSTLYFDLSNKYQEILINKIEKSDYSKFLSDYLNSNLKNMLVLPIYYGENVVGGVVLCNKISDFTAGNVSLASALTNQLGMAVQNIEFLEKEIQIKKEEEQLKIASDIQAKLFPAKFPEINRFQIFGVSFPAKSVGGDYYDIIKLSDNISIGIIADVSGKGVPAALLVSMVRTIFRMVVFENNALDPGEILKRINMVLCSEDLDGRFVTAMCFKIISDEKIIKLSDAGHGNMLIYRAGKKAIEKFESESTVLGIMAEEEYSTVSIPILKDDIMLLYTDGVTDEREISGEFFGSERLEEILRQENKYPAEFITRRIYRQVFKFLNGNVQSDDITIVTVKGV